MQRVFRALFGAGTAVLVFISLTSCGGTRVLIVYHPSPDLDSQAVDPRCVRRVGVTHVHADWLGFDRIPMTPKGDAWEVVLRSVPLNTEHHFRLNDPDACGIDPDGAVTKGITVNGVSVSRIVGTPGAGGKTEPGLSFRVDKHGQVHP